MKRKTASGITLTLLLISMLTLAFNVQPVVAFVSIIIRANGNVDPAGVPILNVGNVSYTFTANISGSIAVERSNIIIDGNGHTLQGTESGNGFDLSNINHVTIKNTVITGFYRGVYLYSSSYNNNISGNNIAANKYGIWLYSSSSNSISRNNIVNNVIGAVLSYSSNNNVSGNNIASNGDGIYLSQSSSNSISRNNIVNNVIGAVLSYSSSNNNVSGNNVTSNDEYGISLDFSSNNILRGNKIANNKYNFFVRGSKLIEFVNDVDASNAVDGKPVYYWVSKRDMDVPPNGGYVALVNCTRITVQNLNLTKNWQGMLIAYTINSKITKNTIKNNEYGIESVYSSNNNVSRNTIVNNRYDIRLSYSSNNHISENNIANSGCGVYLYSSSNNNNVSGNNITTNDWLGIWLNYSSNNHISENNIANSGCGVWLNSSSNNNNVSGNNITSNDEYGVYLSHSLSNIISGNNITANNGYGAVLSYSSYNDVSENSIMANNQSGIRLDSSLGNIISGNNITANNLNGVHLLSSSGNSISRNNMMANNGSGILLSYSSGNDVSGNNIANNRYGIRLDFSSGNRLYVNNLTANSRNGVCSYSSSGNSIYHNNFMNNIGQQVNSTASTNVWDDGYPFGGNYWSNYIGVDFYIGPYQNVIGSDGMGDTPYVIDTNNKDRYPLMKRFTKVYEQSVTIKARGKEYLVLLISNSTLSDVAATSNTLNFTAKGVKGTSGYTWVIFPVGLNTTNIEVFLNGTKLTHPPYPIITTNNTHYFIYFAFNFKSTYKIIINFPEAQFALTTLYTLNLYVNGTLYYGNKLALKFYSYSGAYQGDSIVWSGTTPAHVTLSINVPHPLSQPVEKVALVLTDSLGNILETLSVFLVHRTHLWARTGQLEILWGTPGVPRSLLMKEYVAIDGQWPYAPP